jgi:phosphopantetheinyl transferase (holo-ACP synthase)
LSFEITHIISNESIQIKQIVYEELSIAELDLSILSPADFDKFCGFLSDKRKREFYFTRKLVSTFKEIEKIEYTPNGKPTTNTGHLSISHSKNFIIVAYSASSNLGIDIEFYKEKIHRIKHKFLAKNELKNMDTNDTAVLTIIWSIKEAIYKMEEIPGLRFKDDLIVTSLEHPSKIVVCKNKNREVYTFDYLIYNDFVITYCLSDNLDD